MDLLTFGILLTLGGALSGITIYGYLNGEYEIQDMRDQVIFISACVPILNLALVIVMAIFITLKTIFDKVKKKFQTVTQIIQDYKNREYID